MKITFLIKAIATSCKCSRAFQLILFPILLFLFACKTKTGKSPESFNPTHKLYTVVKPPIKNVDVQSEVFSISTETNNILTTKSGSIIEIPAYSLTDESGVPLKGRSTIHYREFSDPADIMASGIPMNVNDKNANIDKPFISAGMFEIKATHPTCNAIRINSSAPINVKLASNRNGSDYSNFYLNSTTGDWVYAGQGSQFPNERKMELNKQLRKFKTTTGFLGRDYVVFNNQSLIDAYLNEDNERIYKFFENEKWKIPSKLLTYGVKEIGMYSNQDIEHNGFTRPAAMWLWENLDHVHFPPVANGAYASLEKIGNSIYKISLKEYMNDSILFSARLKVVMSLKHMLKFDPEFWKKDYEEAIKEVRKQEEILSKMTDLYREFQVNAFGIYNSDKFYNNPESFEVIAKFNFPGQTELFSPEKVYYVSKNEKLLITYTIQNKTKFMLCKDASARLYTVVKGNYLAEIDPTQLMSLRGKKGELTEADLHFKIKSKITNLSDLKVEMGI